MQNGLPVMCKVKVLKSLWRSKGAEALEIRSELNMCTGNSLMDSVYPATGMNPGRRA